MIGAAPALVAHADWSKHPEKRWLARAAPGDDGGWTAFAPEPVGPLTSLWMRLEAAAGDPPVLLGIDCPLGLPAAYAERAGITDFVQALRRFGVGSACWRGFYDVATTPAEIALTRPFYPARPGGTRQRWLIERLGLCDRKQLLRWCDLATGERPAASSLFWTLGAQQVGKAAIAAWRCLLGPALRGGVNLGIWPFGGPLERLLEERRFVVAETYPREVAAWLGLPLGRRSKRERATRLHCAAALHARARDLGVRLEPALAAAIDDGFGARGDGEDRFDSLVGLLGMLDVVTGRRPAGAPDDPTIRRIEGWILGQTPPDAAPSCPSRS